MKKKVGYILIGILGLLVVFVILMVLFFGDSSLFHGPGVSNEAKAEAAMAQIQAKAEQIYSGNQMYTVLSCVYDEVMMTLCRDVEKRIGVQPTFRLLEDKYCAYIKLDVNRYYCMDSAGSRLESTTDPSGSGYCDGKTFNCPL